MRPFPDPKTALGCLALLGWVALASPGVKLAAAEPAQGARSAAAAAPAPACSGAAPVPDPEIQQLQLRAQLEAAQAAERARQARGAQAGDDEVIALNNRGYNYGPQSFRPPAPGASR